MFDCLLNAKYDIKCKWISCGPRLEMELKLKIFEEL